jgi:response regulator of citrate/malate metabolism
MNLIAWLLGPILESLKRIEQKLDEINRKQDQIMAQVQISQESLDQYASDVSTAADAIAADITALQDAVTQAGVQLPQANVDSLNASLDKLRALDIPDTQPVEEPPA